MKRKVVLALVAALTLTVGSMGTVFAMNSTQGLVIQTSESGNHEHVWGTKEWVVDKEATATAAGSKHEECTVCGYAKEAVDIPATGTTDDPSDENGKPSTETPSKPSDQSGKPSTGTPADTDTSTGDNQTGDAAAPGTGDDSDLAFWIIAVLAAGIVLYNQKRNHSK